jgi:hypothetical protein
MKKEGGNSMRKVCKVLALTVVVAGLALVTCTAALAQDDVFAVSYFSNANTAGAPDAHLRLTNDGNTAGTLWAAIYVFNNDQEMEACCSCYVTPNGYTDLDVNKDLTGNFLTAGEKSTGIIKVVSSSTSSPTSVSPIIGIRGWLTHIQNGATASSFYITEESLKDSVLGSSELSVSLEETCSFVLSLGSGLGTCYCPPEPNI